MGREDGGWGKDGGLVEGKENRKEWKVEEEEKGKVVRRRWRRRRIRRWRSRRKRVRFEEQSEKTVDRGEGRNNGGEKEWKEERERNQISQFTWKWINDLPIKDGWLG